MEGTEGQQVEYLTVEAVAHRTSLSRKTIYNWISDGRIGRAEGLRRIGGARRIYWPAFKKFIEQN